MSKSTVDTGKNVRAVIGWGVDGYGDRHICSSAYEAGRAVVVCPLEPGFFLDCLDLLREQAESEARP